MGLFRKRGEKGDSSAEETRVLVPTSAYCRVCDAEHAFTRVWRRVRVMRQCPCCGLQFDDPGALYKKTQPLCPRCGEYLEQPSFDYGLCDACGSKFEFVEGAKPGLLPNRKQREAMDRHGKSRSIE